MFWADTIADEVARRYKDVIAKGEPIVVRDELAAGELKEFGPLPGLKETFYAITPTRRFPNPLVKELMNAQGRKRANTHDRNR